MGERKSLKLQVAIEQHGQVILNYFERRVPRQDAPDLLANTMLVAWRRVESLPEETEQGRMWLFGVARNVLLEYERGTRRRVRLADRLRVLTRTSDLTSPAVDQGSEVGDAVRRLSPELRELVVLVHWDGMTLAAAAAHLEISASTARSRYQRAKTQLREILVADPAL